MGINFPNNKADHNPVTTAASNAEAELKITMNKALISLSWYPEIDSYFGNYNFQLTHKYLLFSIWFIATWWENTSIIILKWNKWGFKRLKSMPKFIYPTNICRTGIQTCIWVQSQWCNLQSYTASSSI